MSGYKTRANANAQEQVIAPMIEDARKKGETLETRAIAKAINARTARCYFSPGRVAGILKTRSDIERIAPGTWRPVAAGGVPA
jgi:hypothetical protein